jgi:hypothetical protein
VCEPPLDELIRRHAVDIAYFQPELADRIVSEPAPAKPEAQVAPSVSQPLDNAQGAGVEATVVIRPKKDRTAAERQRRYRERRKQAAAVVRRVTLEDGAVTPEGTREIVGEGIVTPAMRPDAVMGEEIVTQPRNATGVIQ